jgi:hypothetical protein
MKACTACTRAIDDHAAACPYCGAGVSGSAPNISWQPLSGSPAPPPQSATAAATARVATPRPPSPQTAGVGWTPVGAAAPFTAPSQPVSQPGFTQPQFAPQYSPRPARGKDSYPAIPRTGAGIGPRLEQARDEVYRWLEAYCAAKGIEPSLLKSTPYSPEVWVSCHMWAPEDPGRTSTDRSKLHVKIYGAPFHRYEILYEVTISIGFGSKICTRICELRQRDIERLMDLVLTGNLNSLKWNSMGLARLRSAPWQFWLPKNKVVGLDYTFVDVVTLLTAVGFIAAATVYGIPLALGCWIAAVIIKVRRARRRWRFQNEGKPLQEPRTLRRFDSWQTLIFDLGREVGLTKQEILSELRKGAVSGFDITTETIWYFGVDETEEREQLVARFRRGIAFIQVYAYGDDMFVGWDAHMNEGAWVEKEVARGLQQGRFVSLRTIEPGRQPLTEYDLFDTNCLVEWVHGAVSKVVRRQMAYHKIDQEIDFSIIRADRKLEQPQENSAQQKPNQKPLLKRLRRVE